MPSCSFAEEPAWVTRRAGSESGTASQIEKAADACALELASEDLLLGISGLRLYKYFRHGGCNRGWLSACVNVGWIVISGIAKICIYTELGFLSWKSEMDILMLIS